MGKSAAKKLAKERLNASAAEAREQASVSDTRHPARRGKSVPRPRKAGAPGESSETLSSARTISPDSGDPAARPQPPPPQLQPQSAELHHAAAVAALTAATMTTTTTTTTDAPAQAYVPLQMHSDCSSGPAPQPQSAPRWPPFSPGMAPGTRPRTIPMIARELEEVQRAMQQDLLRSGSAQPASSQRQSTTGGNFWPGPPLAAPGVAPLTAPPQAAASAIELQAQAAAHARKFLQQLRLYLHRQHNGSAIYALVRESMAMCAAQQASIFKLQTTLRGALREHPKALRALCRTLRIIHQIVNLGMSIPVRAAQLPHALRHGRPPQHPVRPSSAPGMPSQWLQLLRQSPAPPTPRSHSGLPFQLPPLSPPARPHAPPHSRQPQPQQPAHLASSLQGLHGLSATALANMLLQRGATPPPGGVPMLSPRPMPPSPRPAPQQRRRSDSEATELLLQQALQSVSLAQARGPAQPPAPPPPPQPTGPSPPPASAPVQSAPPPGVPASEDVLRALTALLERIAPHSDSVV